LIENVESEYVFPTALHVVVLLVKEKYGLKGVRE